MNILWHYGYDVAGKNGSYSGHLWTIKKKDQSLSCESLWTAPRRVSSINSSKVQWKEFPDEVRLAVLGCSWG